MGLSTKHGGKNVQFGPKLCINVHEFEKIADHASVWWTREERKEMEREYEAVLFLMDTKKPIDEDEHSARGLEKKTEEGAWVLYESQRDALNAVLGEQEKLRRERTTGDCSERVADAYQEATAQTKLVALERGAQDYAEIKDYLHGISHCRVPSSPKRQVRKVSPPSSPTLESPAKRRWGRKISMPLMAPLEHAQLQSSSINKKLVKAAALVLARQQVSAKKMSTPKDDNKKVEEGDEEKLSVKEKVKSKVKKKARTEKASDGKEGKKVKKSSKSSRSSSLSSPPSPDKPKKRKSASTKSSLAKTTTNSDDPIIGGSITPKHDDSKITKSASSEVKKQVEKDGKSTQSTEATPPNRAGENDRVRSKISRSKSPTKRSKKTESSSKKDQQGTPAAAAESEPCGEPSKKKMSTKKTSAATTSLLDSPKKMRKPKKANEVEESSCSSPKKKKFSTPRLTRSSSLTNMETKLAKLSSDLDLLLQPKPLREERSSASTEPNDSGDDDEQSFSYLPSPMAIAVTPKHDRRPRLFLNRVMKSFRRNNNNNNNDEYKSSLDSSLSCFDDESLGDYSESAESCCF